MSLPGGFFPASTTHVASPAPSNYSSTPARTPNNLLPNPRSTPLKSGSKRESAFINYVDNALLEVSRKFTKKFPSEEEKNDSFDFTKFNTEGTATAANDGKTADSDKTDTAVIGYSNVEPLVEDLEKIIGLVWVSGTASLQIAYLLQIASSLLQYLPPFPPNPTPTFRLLNRLDLAFHTLIAGYKMSGTEKVRLSSIVKVTRAMMIRLMEGQDFVADSDDDEEEYEDKDGINYNDTDEEDDNDHMHGVQSGGKQEDRPTRIKEEDLSDSDSDLERTEKKVVVDDDMEVDEETEGEASRLQRKYKRPTQKEVDRTERLVKEENEDEDWEIEVARVYSRVLELIGGEIGVDPIGIVVDE